MSKEKDAPKNPEPRPVYPVEILKRCGVDGVSLKAGETVHLSLGRAREMERDGKGTITSLTPIDTSASAAETPTPPKKRRGERKAEASDSPVEEESPEGVGGDTEGARLRAG